MKKLAFAGAAVALAVSLGTAKASTIAFDTMGPSGIFDPYAGWNIGGGANGSLDFNNLPAAQFTSLASGTVSELSAAIWRLDDAATPIYFQLRADSAGLPGSVLGQALVSASNEREVQKVSFQGIGVALSAGTNYWFSIEAIEPATEAAWMFNTFGVNAPLAILHSPLTPPGSDTWHLSSSATAPAFRVDVALVPEPTTVLLLMMGLSIISIRLSRPSGT
ncbi:MULTISPECIES: PEP-CTERM sorting domain-containing protein [unclassified Roseateles]|uniref:PEP-CTERM sorting domain-containing protein n=1 Tax=unclassified Roseateles TaxID=2626991 RepID=UPI000ACC3D45|nr:MULTISPECIES: PEP-CTERM sorting domain-containing protein [unclassified Roseateles]